uniref:Zn(2)-C6 fungal-type domain-containing protein n=1 Tax=Bionectria ochroleuca TaxID=29856 RepID=A0A8H7K4J0_BIOOC
MASVSCSDNAAPRTKLRNSCDACSLAKIKCTQERPECSYCAKRLKPCVYSASKRVKRSQRKPQHHDGREACTSSTTLPSGSTIWESPLSAALESAGSYSSLPLVMSAESSSSQGSRPATPHLGQEWSDFFTTLRSPLVASPPTGQVSSAEWANLDPSSIESFSLLDDSIFDLSAPIHSFEKNNGTGSKKNTNSPSTIFCNPGPMDEPTEVRNSLPRASNIIHRHSLSADMQASSGLASGESRDISPSIHLGLGSRRASSAVPQAPRCSCNSQILRFFGQLSIDPSGPWIASRGGQANSPQNPTFQQVYEQIATMALEIGKILQCDCSSNLEGLILLSLVIFKIQAWYTAAANAALGSYSDEATTNMGQGSLDQNPMWRSEQGRDDREDEGEDQRRIFLQDLLSRLTGLQVLIGRFSERLTHAEAELGRNSTTSGSNTTQHQIVVPPFPGQQYGYWPPICAVGWVACHEQLLRSFG